MYAEGGGGGGGANLGYRQEGGTKAYVGCYTLHLLGGRRGGGGGKCPSPPYSPAQEEAEIIIVVMFISQHAGVDRIRQTGRWTHVHHEHSYQAS